MNHIFSAIILSLSSNIDNLGLGIAYGIRNRRIQIDKNLIIAAVTGIGTWLAMAAGEQINNYMPEELANLLGSGVLILIGLINLLHTLDEAFGPKVLPAPHPVTGYMEGQRIKMAEALGLAISLSFNNVGGGIGAGISHISIPVTVLLSTLFSLAAISWGYTLGRQASAKVPKVWISFLSGILITGLGIYELFID